MTGARAASLTPRLAGVFFLLVGLGSLATALLATGEAATDGPGRPGLWWIVGFSLVVALGAFVIPWDALPPPLGLSLPVAALVLLVLVEQLSDYSATRQAAAVYPIYVVAVLTWVGLTQPRATAAAFGLCTAAALGLCAAAQPRPVAAAVVGPRHRAGGHAGGRDLRLAQHAGRRAVTP